MINNSEGTLPFKEWKKSIEENCAGCTFTCNELLKMYFDEMDAVMLKTGHNSNTIKEMYALAAEYGVNKVNFTQFWHMRFPTQGTMYMEDWARRLRGGFAIEKADRETLRALIDCGLVELKDGEYKQI